MSLPCTTILTPTHTHNPNLLVLLTNVLDETFIDKLLHSLPSGGKVDFFNGYLAIPFLESVSVSISKSAFPFFPPSSLIRVFIVHAIYLLFGEEVFLSGDVRGVLRLAFRL